MPRTVPKTIKRREHWRWQRCGKGRTELRRIHVRGTSVTLAPVDTRQLDMLDPAAGRGGRKAAARTRHALPPAAPRPVLRSYWRRQPFGPGSRLRKTILVDVHA